MVKIPKATKAIICDFDQTLVKFIVDWDQLRQTTADIFKKNGFEVDSKSLRPIFEQTAKQLQFLENSCTSDKIISQISADLLAAQETFELESINAIILFPDTRPFLRYISDQGLKTGLLTSNTSSVTKKIFSRFRISPEIPIIGREDVKYPKPNLEGITKLLEKLNLPGESCVLIGDTDSDMDIANKIGALAVFLKRSESQYLSHSKPDFTINSLSEISF